jgi:hypothetical protein
MQLSELHDSIWSLLGEGVESASSPFHTPALATVGEDGPELRTVVLRSADAERRQISCHTDWRSPKRRQVEQDRRVCWLFYDRDRKVQIRLRGQAVLHNVSEEARKRWDATPPRGRSCYSTLLAPGTPVDEPPEAPTALDVGFDNFAIMLCTVDLIDWLFLQAAGHQRAQLHWREGVWKAGWVAP